jgi:uncharacterized RDD family membrane protein YckC
MSTNPYAPPTTPVADPGAPSPDVRYAGFWIRVLAAIIDSIIVLAITLPLLMGIYGESYYAETKGLIAGPADFLISWVAPAVAAIAFWVTKQATPGKMLVSAKIVDAKTGQAPTVRQSIVRYLGYFVAGLPLGLGILWVAFDPRKQGWHDKLAGTVVVRSR